jgi:hypothetical protein
MEKDFNMKIDADCSLHQQNNFISYRNRSNEPRRNTKSSTITTMTPYEAYCEYLAIKQHFTLDKYDYIKYNGKVRASENAFRSRRDRLLYTKVARHYEKEEFRNLLVSNFVLNEKMQSLSYSFKEECDKILDYMDSEDLKFDELFKGDDYNLPEVLNLLQREVITLETVIIMDEVLHFLKRFDKKYSDNIFCKDMVRKIRKYRPFVPLTDILKYRKIMKNIFT